MKKNYLLVFIAFLIFISIIGFTFKKVNNKNNNFTTIKLAEVTHSVFYAPLYVAIEKGYFEDEGINIDLILTPGADKVSAAVLSGDADVGFAGAESAIYVYTGGEKDYLQIFCGLTKRDGQFIISRVKNDNFSLKDLEGKEILTGRLSGMPALSFLNAVEKNGINKNKININSSVDFSSLSGAFIGGTGDYVNLFEPNATLLENMGYGYVVASVGALSGDVPYTTFYARKSYIDNNTELLIKFTKAINKALNYVNENDSETVAKDIIKQFNDTNINELTKMIDRYKNYEVWLNNPYVNEEIFTNLENLLIKNELIENKVAYTTIVNNLYEKGN